MDKQNLFVKVCINPNACVSYDFRHELFPVKRVNLKILLKSSHDLNQVVAALRDNFKGKYDYNVMFSFKNVPETIKQNDHFKTEIIKLFQSSNHEPKIEMKTFEHIIDEIKEEEPVKVSQTDNIITWGDQIKNQIKSYGAHPDFSKAQNDKQRKKIYNYIKTNLGLPKLSKEDLEKVRHYVLAGVDIQV